MTTGVLTDHCVLGDGTVDAWQPHSLGQTDGDLTWNSSWPQFTKCFQQVALTSCPCALLWLTSLLYRYYLMTLKDDVIPTGGVNNLKMTCYTLLALLSLCELTCYHLEQGTLVDVTQFRVTAHTFAPLVLLFTVMLSWSLTRLEQQKGQRSSALLFLFWLMMTLCQTVPLCTILMTQVYVRDPVSSAVSLGKLAVLLFLTVLQCLAEPSPTLPPSAQGQRMCPDLYEPLWSRLLFSFVNDFLRKGKEGKITETDLFGLLPGEQCCNATDRFFPYWQREVDNAQSKNQTSSPGTGNDQALGKRLDQTVKEGEKGRRKWVHHLHRARSVEEARNKKGAAVFNRCQSEIHHHMESESLLRTDSEEEEQKVNRPEQRRQEGEGGSKRKSGRSGARPNFFLALFKCFWVDFTIRLLGFLLWTSLDMTEHFLFGVLVFHLEGEEAPQWSGYLLVGAMLVTRVVRTVVSDRSALGVWHFHFRIRACITNSIFQKALTMDTQSRQESTVGQVVNLLSVDTGEISHAFTWMAQEMFCAPVKIIVCLVMLYRVLGPSMLISVAMLAVMVPINSVVARKLSGCHKKIMELKDARLKMFTEVINGMKILKMYAWEQSFIEKVNEARNRELEMIWWRFVCETALHFYSSVSPYMVSLTMFLVYVYSSEDHYMSPSVAFVALSLMNTLKNNMGVVPHIITTFVKVVVSFNRLTDFLGRTDLEGNTASEEDDSVSIQGGFFTWNRGTAPILKNINLSVKKGSLVAVVGPVGCGKSSLISACLGEMARLKGKVSIKGTVAYVPQQAWLQHASVKDNVVFGQAVDEDLYQRCVDHCALRPDLHILPRGDSTEIGEKGINLSGGQKQRVSLARAAYSQADVYLLDDPLSAVDCHVGSHIFDKLLGPKGMLAGKTRVLVTHGVQWLPKVDHIIVIRHGRVSETGSYDQLLSHNGPFAKFLKSYLVHHPEEVHPDPLMKKMEADILHRLESIPSDPEDSSEMSGAENSTDNDSIIQDLMRSAGLEQADQQEADNKSGDDVSADDLDEAAKDEEGKNNSEKKVKSETNGCLVEEDDYKVKQVDWSTLRDFAQAIGFSWAVVLLALMTAQHWANRAGELSLSGWSDDPQLNNLTLLPRDSQERVSLNNHYLMVYAGFGMLYAITTVIFRIITLFRRMVMARILHDRMLSCVLRAPMSFFDTTPSGRIVNRFSSDLTTVDSNLMDNMEMTLQLTFSWVGTACLIGYATPAFFLTIIPSMLIWKYVHKYFAPSTRALERLESKTRGPIYSYFSETLGGAAVIRAYGAQRRFTAEFQRRCDLFNSIRQTWVCCNKWLHVRIEGIMLIMLTTVAVMAVTYRDVMSAGIAGLAVSKTMELTNSLYRLIHATTWLQTQLVSVDRVKEYCTLKQEADWRKESTKPCSSWPQEGKVTAHDLAVRYRDGLDLVLKGINVNIAAGEKVGIVGRTGAGKSSLTLALFRLIEPARGEFRIDDVSINDLGLHDLRTKLTILPQDPVIFAGSVRMNLDPFCQFKEEEVWEALRHAHLRDFVCGLKDGLKHECGEGGENLSVGQRQLLCLARTLLHKSQVLVLDEATAAVDMETDDLIQNTIRSQFRHCTVLTIAHRLNTVIDYDKILVLDKGQVVEYDTPGSLMDNPFSIFHDMCKEAGLLHKRHTHC